jgi:diguanylate cyclase (GGDEF)-like protein
MHTTQKDTPLKILIVEDESITALDVSFELTKIGYEVCGMEDTASRAIASVQKNKPDLILMDIRLGDGGDGVEAAKQISQDHDLPIVFLTAHSDGQTLSRALDVSPYGYIVKPFRSDELRVAIQLALSKHASDRQKEKVISQVALTDPLTGLGNRRCFDEALSQEWARASRENLLMSLIMIDIDHFKALNDTYGHAHGDKCLQAVAQALKSCCTRLGDTVCRWGGEEFAVILTKTDLSGAEKVGTELIGAVKDLGIVHVGSSSAPHVTISAGAACNLSGVDSKDMLMKQADAALYKAKKEGRNRLVLADTLSSAP